MSKSFFSNRTRSSSRNKKPSLIHNNSNRELALLKSSNDNNLSENLTKKSLHKSTLPNKNSSDLQLKYLQQNNALLPIHDLYRAIATPCQVTKRTKLDIETKQDETKCALRLQISINAGNELDNNGKR